jgi:hypothetical protein
MAESVKYQRIVLRMESPWNLGTATSHEWSVKFSLSGASGLPGGSQEATALDLWQPIAAITSAHTSLVGWDHYPNESSTHDGNAIYPIGTHVGTAQAWTVGQANQQLEVCLLAICPVGTSSKGRPVYLRKWIHDVQNSAGDLNAHGTLANAATLFDKWNHGAGPSLLVPVSPTTGVQGGPWTVEQHLYTHQLRRSPKHKIKTVTVLVPTPIP